MGKRYLPAPDQLVNPTSFTYDVLGRLRSTVEPNGATTSVAYGVSAPGGSAVAEFASQVTDANGHTRTVWHDAKGRQVALEEPRADDGALPITRYGYDALGELRSVTDAEGNVTSMSYDLLGRRLSLSNPDTGTTAWRYDPAGDLVHEATADLLAAGKTIDYDYEFTRLKSVTRPDQGKVTYEYGPADGSAHNGTGRVVKVTDEVGTKAFTYDVLGQVTSKTRVLNPLKPGEGLRTFTTAFDWDVYGRMLSLTYPDGEVLRYGYDHGGRVKSAVGTRPASHWYKGQTETYLAALTYDVFGHRTYLAMGNGVSSTYVYNPLTLRLASLKTKSSTGRVLQALTYGYDLVGNVTSVANALGPATGHRSGALRYAYQYDAEDQLIQAKGVAKSRPGVRDEFSADFTYSAIHDMTSNRRVRTLLKAKGPEVVSFHPETSSHAWASYGGSGPHRATQIGQTLFAYDASGNTVLECTPALGQEVATCSGATGQGHLRRYLWTDDGLLRAVVATGGGHYARFLYDGAGQRVVKEGTGGESITLGQFFSVKGHSFATKQVFVGKTRLAAKLLPQPEVATWGNGGGQNDGTELPGCEPSGETPEKCPVVSGGPVGVGLGGRVRPATYYYHPDHLGSPPHHDFLRHLFEGAIVLVGGADVEAKKARAWSVHRKAEVGCGPPPAEGRGVGHDLPRAWGHGGYPVGVA